MNFSHVALFLIPGAARQSYWHNLGCDSNSWEI